jgi:hypothetical protein
MKTIATVFILVFSMSSFAQNEGKGRPEHSILSNTHWKVSGGCFEDAATKSYDLYSYNKDSAQFNWGHFISFTQNTFSTNYSAPCGNDCFTSVTGTYEVFGRNRVKIFVENISRSGFCSQKSETPNESFGFYTIIETPTGLRLEKENQK